MKDNTHEIISTIGGATAKAAPPLTVAGLTIAGFPLSDLVLILTGIYTIVQIALGLVRLYEWSQKRNKKENDNDDGPPKGTA